MSSELSRFALDATLPLLRPDSVVRRITPGLWGLYTPSCWSNREPKSDGWVLKLGDQEDLVQELRKVGNVVERQFEFVVQGNIIDPTWWIHRAEDGMIPAEILRGKISDADWTQLENKIQWRLAHG